jgi:hypothetical protein
MLTRSIAIALVAAGTIGLSSINADAALRHHVSRCDDMGFARDGGGWEADPVCEADLAAHIAHKSGYHYSAAQLYSNPASMDEFCRGEDNIELTTACAPYDD